MTNCSTEYQAPRTEYFLNWPGSLTILEDQSRFEPLHDKTNKMTRAPSEDSDQPWHPPSLIRVFAVRMMKAWTLSCPLSAQRRLLSDWADAQADLSLGWAHMPFCWFCHEAAHLTMSSTVLIFLDSRNERCQTHQRQQYREVSTLLE